MSRILIEGVEYFLENEYDKMFIDLLVNRAILVRSSTDSVTPEFAITIHIFNPSHIFESFVEVSKLQLIPEASVLSSGRMISIVSQLTSDLINKLKQRIALSLSKCINSIVRESIEAEFTSFTYASLVGDLQNPYLMIDHKKEAVKYKTKTPTEAKAVKITYDDFDMNLGTKWHDYATAKMPSGKFDLIKFAEAISKIKRTIDLSDDEMDYLFNWIIEDEFWQNVAISPCGLLNRSANGNRKVENILMRIKAELMATNQVYRAEEKKRLMTDDQKEDSDIKTQLMMIRDPDKDKAKEVKK